MKYRLFGNPSQAASMPPQKAIRPLVGVRPTLGTTGLNWQKTIHCETTNETTIVLVESTSICDKFSIKTAQIYFEKDISIPFKENFNLYKHQLQCLSC